MPDESQVFFADFGKSGTRPCEQSAEMKFLHTQKQNGEQGLRTANNPRQREPVWSNGVYTRECDEQVAEHYITAVAIFDCTGGDKNFAEARTK